MYILYNTKTGTFGYSETNEVTDLYSNLKIAEVSEKDYWEAVENNKIYNGTKFIEKPPATKSKAEQITEIKRYYDKRFETLEQMVLRRRLINGDISDLQEQYKKLNMEMLAKIKEVK